MSIGIINMGAFILIIVIVIIFKTSDAISDFFFELEVARNKKKEIKFQLESKEEQIKIKKSKNDIIKEKCNNIFDNLGQEFDEYYKEKYLQRLEKQQRLKIKNIIRTSSNNSYYEQLNFRGYLYFYKKGIKYFISFPGPDNRYKHKTFSLISNDIGIFIIELNKCYSKFKDLKAKVPAGGHYFEIHGFGLEIVFYSYGKGIKFNDYDRIKVHNDFTFIQQMADLKYCWDMLIAIYDINKL